MSQEARSESLVNLPDLLELLVTSDQFLGKDNAKSYPVSLPIKQRSSVLNHLLICLFLAYAGSEIRRIGMHLV